MKPMKNQYSIFCLVGIFLLIFAYLVPAIDYEHPPSISVKPHMGGGNAVTFRYNPDMENVETVALAGTFNGWDPKVDIMNGPDEKYAFSITKQLLDGAYAYKYVINGEKWINDPLNPHKIDDGHQGYNSILLIGADAKVEDAMKARPKQYEVDPDFETPEWAKHVVWYQIFPERFRNGREKNDPPDVLAWTSDWFELQEGENEVSFYKTFIWQRRYGGDFQGVMKKLDYLKDLGITAIYFNPIFEAPSLHKYDAVTYLHVDDNFGYKGDLDKIVEDWLDFSTWKWTKSDRYFLKLVDECHDRGIKVIIDGVFNHVSNQNKALLDVKKKGKDSPFADWFDVETWEPFKVKGWAGFGMMPEFREGPEGFETSLKKHLFEITTRWMDPDGDGDPSDGIDGWRLDVPFDVSRAFWEDWRAHVKSINPEAYLVGEIWGDPVEWLTGDAFDATMNYDFAKICQNFFIDKKNKITATEFHERLSHLLESIPKPSQYVMQNLYDSHDTDRLVSQIANPDRTYDQANRIQSPEAKDYMGRRPGEDAYEIQRLMAAFQMTFVGAPMIYNGDEVGMFGADDPHNRMPMWWKDLEPYENAEDIYVNKNLLDYYTRLVAIRNTYPSLRTGDFRKALSHDEKDVYAFWRFIPLKREGRLLIALNNSEKEQEFEVASPLVSLGPMLPAGKPYPDGSKFAEVLHSPAKYDHAEIAFNGAKWKTIKITEDTKITPIKDGKMKINLSPKQAKIFTYISEEE